MKQDRLRETIRKYSNIFGQDARDGGPYIPDDKIPPIDWFYEKNRGRLNRKKKPWYASGGFWIPVSSALALCIFLFATPPGTAVADVAYKTVVQWFSGRVEIERQAGTMPDVWNTPGTAAESFCTLEELRAKCPYKIACNALADATKIELTETDYSATIHIVYTYRGCTLAVTQRILTYQTKWANSIGLGDGKAFREALKDGTEFTGTVDGCNCYAVGFKDNMSVEVASKDASGEQFAAFIKDMELK